MMARVSRFLVRGQINDLQILAANLIDPVLAKNVYVANRYEVLDGVCYQYVHRQTPQGYSTGLEEARK